MTNTEGTQNMTFDQWNNSETTRICAGEPEGIASIVRNARRGTFARVALREGYVDACRRAGIQPEPMFG